MLLRFRLRIDRFQLLKQRLRLLLVLHQRVDAAHRGLHARLQDLFRDLLFIEDHHFLDVAHAALQVFAQRHHFADHDRRPRDRLQHAKLSPLDALGDFNLALARQQRYRAHLPQVHADRVVRLLECSRCQVQLNVVALFGVFRVELLRPGKLGLAFEQVDALGVNGRDEIVKVICRMHVVRQQIVYLAIGEVTLFLALIHQFLDIVFELVFNRQSAPCLPALFRRCAAVSLQ